MGNIALQFQTPQDFTAFRAFIKDRPTAIDISQLIIYCNCLTEEVEAAIRMFGGKILQH